VRLFLYLIAALNVVILVSDQVRVSRT